MRYISQETEAFIAFEQQGIQVANDLIIYPLNGFVKNKPRKIELEIHDSVTLLCIRTLNNKSQARPNGGCLAFIVLENTLQIFNTLIQDGRVRSMILFLLVNLAE